MKLFGYLAFSGLCFGLLYVSSLLFDHSKPPTISKEAIKPDLFLGNSKVYAQEHAYSRSLEHLDKAILAIKNIEQEIDPQSRKTVDKAVHQLQMVHDEIKADTLNVKDMNKAFLNALNALTYAEIKVTEQYIASHDLDKAKVALKYGMLHLKNALKFSQGKIREYEIQMYAELDSIIENQHLSDDEIIARLEHLLSRLDTLVTN